jgi:hypothetical protein
MKKSLILITVFITGLPLFSQSQFSSVAPGAANSLSSLLDNPTMVSAPNAAPLGRNWFTLVTDIHVFTQEVTVRQVAAALTDFNNQETFFNGRRSKQRLTIVSRSQNSVIADYTSIMVVLGIQLRTPYRTEITVTENTDTRFVLEFRQLASDSDKNTNVKNLYVIRYAEEVTINGRKYTYIRMYVTQDVNASILPGAKATLENNSTPVNIEAMQLIIAVAKTK